MRVALLCIAVSREIINNFPFIVVLIWRGWLDDQTKGCENYRKACEIFVVVFVCLCTKQSLFVLDTFL